MTAARRGSVRVVAIDGPAGSGKSTIARGVADALSLRVLDTGAMYRAATLVALERGLDLGDGDAVADAVRAADIAVGEDGQGLVELDGRDVSAEIRGPAVTAAVSIVSAHPSVREVMVARQRDWAERYDGGVVEGRDIGTVVFPDAPLKVFLTASDEVRARRRQRDERAAARPTDVQAVQDSLARRDALDSGRAASPLRAADDALVIDTSGRTVEDVVDEVLAAFRSVVEVGP